MNKAEIVLGLVGAAIVFGGWVPLPARGQITPDATLPNNSIVLPDGSVFTIDGGTAAGSNLFHSFQDFNLPTGHEAFFNNAASIDNIITRITGDNLSDIDGLIRANGTANLFLINPNGIQFGPNARLDIGGSFFGSTAESVLFADGSLFSATEPNVQPLLSVNVPVGLQMGTNPGNIAVRGMGHSLQVRSSGFESLDRGDTSASLQVDPGETLALLGGEVTLDGGLLVAESGRVEIGSANSGVVRLEPTETGTMFDYENAGDFGDIQLHSQALADASGEGGSIQVRGRNIELLDGSSLLIQNQGERSGSIVVTASEAIHIIGQSQTTNAQGLTIHTGFEAQNLGRGKGADILVSGRHINVVDGAIISSANFGEGVGGDVTVTASESLQMFGIAPLPGDPVNRIQSLAFPAGDAGNTTITTDRLIIRDGGQVSATTLGSGNGGSLTINALDFIEVIGINPQMGLGDPRSAIQSRSINTGNAGKLTVNTANLRIRDGGSLSVSTVASGNAGNLSIFATESIEVSGFTVLDGEPIFSSIQSEAQFPSPLFQRILGLAPVPSGDAGTIAISTGELRITDGAQITVGNVGAGNAGDIRINADRVTLDSLGTIAASTVSGAGGNIDLQVQDSLQLRRGSSIAAEAGGMGNGGNLSLTQSTSALLENSRINANARAGAGGNIEITTQGLFISPDSSISASSQFGVDGIVTVKNPSLEPASGLVTLNTEPLNRNTQIQNSCAVALENRFAIVGNGGLPADPSQVLPERTVWRDIRLGEIPAEVTSNFIETPPEVSATPPMLSPTPIVEATGWQRNDRGQIELIATSDRSSHSSWQPQPECDSPAIDRLQS
ncbi:MAG: S-layer family protein [Cyanobacteriota bacterium]|nr:S-layer family protein [Cyanobacteriota bacterium]